MQGVRVGTVWSAPARMATSASSTFQGRPAKYCAIVAAMNASNSLVEGSRVLHGACPHDCPDTCALRVTVEAGKVVKVQGDADHPTTHGALCTKVSRYAERVYHPERVLHPLKRVGPKGEGRFVRVSWDRALGEIAARLGAIAERDAQAIVPYSYAGTMGLVQGESMDRRFFHKLGASLLDRTICSSAGGDALAATYGGKVGMHVEDYAASRLILIWGSNSIASNLHFWTYAQAAKRSGAQLVCIDPRKTETADKCQQHIALMPGTDGALALGLMHELIVNQWLDDDYIARHTSGWPALRERALQWPPERVAFVCGITAEEVRGLARDYAAARPAAIRANYGMQRVRGGGNATRLIAILPCLVGAWRQRGGGLLLSSSGAYPVDRHALQRPDLLAGRKPRTINMSTIGDDLLREAGEVLPGGTRFGPKIEALIVYNSNPVAVAPESAKVVRGLRARRLVHGRARALPDRHRRPCRLRAAGHDPARTPGRARQLRPHLGADQRTRHCATGRGAAQHADLSRSGRAHGLR